MPIAPAKPRLEFRASTRLLNCLPLTNGYQHVGNSVLICSGKHAGCIGRIVEAVTAENELETCVGDKGRRGVYYIVELPTAVLVGLTWQDFLKLGGP